MPALTPTEANLHRKLSPVACGCGIRSWACRFYSLLALREGDIKFIPGEGIFVDIQEVQCAVMLRLGEIFGDQWKPCLPSRS